MIVRDAMVPLLHKEIANQLRSHSPLEYQLALRKLELLGSEATITAPIAAALCAGLRSRNDWLRERTASALAKVPSRRCRKGLIESLSDRNPAVRDYACQALEAIRDPAAAPRLVQILSDPDEQVRYSALYALASIKGRLDMQLMVRMLQDRSALVRLAAASTLARIDAPKAEALMRKHLKREKDGLVRCDLLEALYLRTGSDSFLARLLKVGRSGRGPVRMRVYEALGRIADRGNATAILSFLRSRKRSENSKLGKRVLTATEKKIRECVSRWA